MYVLNLLCYIARLQWRVFSVFLWGEGGKGFQKFKNSKGNDNFVSFGTNNKLMLQL